MRNKLEHPSSAELGAQGTEAARDVRIDADFPVALFFRVGFPTQFSAYRKVLVDGGGIEELAMDGNRFNDPAILEWN